MNKIILLFFGILLITGCARHNIIIPNNGSPQLITDLNILVNSPEGAEETLSQWLMSETNFNSTSNKIELVDEYDKYFNLRLTTSIIINGRESGIMGFRDYKLDKDGKLFGYYYYK